MMNFWKVMLVIAAMSLPAVSFAVKTPDVSAYLHAGDEIVCIGDSITAQGIYDAYLQQAIDALYPGAGIRVVARGISGQTSSAGPKILSDYLAEGKPTVVLVMFGVNNTRGAVDQYPAKERGFLDGLQKTVTLAREHNLPIIFLRETPFSHGVQLDMWAATNNDTLYRLHAAQTLFAVENNVPIIDVCGAYQRALAAAWAKDPRYEFSPDAIHPTRPGHAAMASEILRAFGGGLPLAIGQSRGPLQLTATPSAVSLQVLDGLGIIEKQGKNERSVQVRVLARNITPQPVSGELQLLIGKHRSTKPLKLSAFGNAIVSFDVPRATLADRYGIQAVYTAFHGESIFDVANSLFFYTSVLPAAAKPVTLAKTDFHIAGVGDVNNCPVTDISVQRKTDRLQVSFSWVDETPVYAAPGYKDRYGKLVETNLNLQERAGQLCDAVEIFLDTRAVESIGRFTANNDNNPEGIARIGLHKTLTGEKVATAFESLPNLPSDAVTLTQTDANHYSLEIALPEEAVIGFAMRVTDAQTFARDKNSVYYLTGHPTTLQEPMGYYYLGTQQEQLFYRIGY